MLKTIIFKNLLYYRAKTALTVGLLVLLFFIALSAAALTARIRALSDRPLESLQTEIILEKDQAGQDPAAIRTQGVIEPFNLAAFDPDSVRTVLKDLPQIADISTALVLWQFDLENSKTMVALDVNDPPVGLRKIEDWLMPGGGFFSANSAPEVILERHFATLFGYKPGGAYRIAGRDFRITGLVDFREESNLVNAQIFLPRETALALLPESAPIANQVYVSLGSAAGLRAVEERIGELLPDFSIITKDRLLKNVSAFNRLVYRFGNYFVLTISALVIVLSLFILKIHRLDFTGQTNILKTIGWPSGAILRWRMVEAVSLLALALAVSLVLLAAFDLAVLHNIRISGLLDQNFKL